jgi:hypothetical protein
MWNLKTELDPIRLMAPVVRFQTPACVSAPRHEELVRCLPAARPLVSPPNAACYDRGWEGEDVPDALAREQYSGRYARLQHPLAGGKQRRDLERLHVLQRRLIDGMPEEEKDFSLLWLTAALAGLATQWDIMEVERDECLQRLLLALESKAEGRPVPRNLLVPLAENDEIDRMLLEMGFWKLYNNLHCSPRGWTELARVEIRHLEGSERLLEPPEWVEKKVKACVKAKVIQVRFDSWPWFEKFEPAKGARWDGYHQGSLRDPSEGYRLHLPAVGGTPEVRSKIDRFDWKYGGVGLGGGFVPVNVLSRFFCPDCQRGKGSVAQRHQLAQGRNA